MKTSAGIISYEIYNQEGKNELSISQQEQFTQLLKLKLRNSSPYHQVLFQPNKKPHLTLKFKKGILPKGFKSSHVKIFKYRLVKGSDLFSQEALDGYLFDKAKMEQDENFQIDIQKILDSIDATQAMRSVVTEDKTLGIDSILQHFNSLKPEEKATTYKWIGQLEQIQKDYQTALSDIRKLALSNDVIKANPLFTSIIQEVADVFEKLTQLQEYSVDLERSLESLAQQVHAQQKADIQSLEANFERNYKNATQHLVKALQTNLKTIIVDALHGTKIKDITNLQSLSLDEDIIKKLETRVFTQADIQDTDWSVEITTSDEEDAIHFTCNKKLTLSPNEYLLVDFELVGALRGSAESVATELNYNQLVFQKNGVEDKAVKDKISQSVLNLVNDGAFGIPPSLELLVAEGKEILNNGAYSNTVRLDLINKGLDNITLSDASKINLSFYNQQENETVAYALQGKDDQLSAVKAVIPSLNIRRFLLRNKVLLNRRLKINVNNIKHLKIPFQDFSAVFYTNYNAPIKPNKTRTKVFTGVIGVKAYNNQIAIYQPFPNAGNPNVRDLETKEVTNNQFNNLNDKDFQLVDEPMELKGTFYINTSKLLLPGRSDLINVSLAGIDNRQRAINLEKSSNTSTIQTTYENQNSIKTVVAPNQAFKLTLNGIKTQLPVGEAILKVSLLNIPNYKDAHLYVALNRVAYLNSSKKGVFTTGDKNNNLQIIQDKVEIRSNNFEVHDNVYKVLPVGAVIMWYGSTDKIPGGWRLCDGRNGTPDLRDRFVVGAGRSYSKGAKGGQNEVKLSTNQIPSHDHDIKINNTNIENGSGSGDLQLMYKDTYMRKFKDGSKTGYDRKANSTQWRLKNAIKLSHSHTADVKSTGGGQSHENRPPYYALFYIMRVN